MGPWRSDNILYLTCPGFMNCSVTSCLCIESRHRSCERLGDAVHSVSGFPISCLAQLGTTGSISSLPDALHKQPPGVLVDCAKCHTSPTLAMPGSWVCVTGGVPGPLVFGRMSRMLVLFGGSSSKAPNKRIGGSGSLACYLPASTAPYRLLVGAPTSVFQEDPALLIWPRFPCQVSKACILEPVCSFEVRHGFHPDVLRDFMCLMHPPVDAPSGHGIDEAPNKRIGGSGSLARLLPYPFWFPAKSFEAGYHYVCDGILVVAFFHTLLLLAFVMIWQLLISAIPIRKSRLGRVIALSAAKPPAQALLPLGSVCRPSRPILSMCPLRRGLHVRPVRSVPWSTRLCCFALLSCPRLLWAAPSDIPGPSEGFGPHFVGPSLAERLDIVLPEPLPAPPDPSANQACGSAAISDNFGRFRDVAAGVREASLHEACEQVVHTLHRAETSLSAVDVPDAPGIPSGIDEGDADFEDLSVDLTDARDQHTQAPGATKLLPVLLAAPGYPMETVWINTTIPATVSRLCSDLREVGSGLFGEIGDSLTPTHPQLEIGLASFLVTPPWFPEANLAAVLIDARAVQGSVFAAVLSYPTCLDEIHRAIGFLSVGTHEVYAAGDSDPLPAGRPIPLQNGVLVKLLPPHRIPFWAPPLAFALWHPYLWPAGASIPPPGYGLRALILHHSGKYVLDNFGDDDWANLNNVARLVGIPLADLSVEPAGQDELYPYVYHGARIRCVLAVTPKLPPRNNLGLPMSYVLFVDSRPVGFDVNFLCLDQGHIRRDQLKQHLQHPPPPGWQLVVRGGQKRDQGYDFVHGEVLTLAFAHSKEACEESPESAEGFSPDEEEPFDDSSSERRARTRTRSRTPGRGPSPRADPDASSEPLLPRT